MSFFSFHYTSLLPEPSAFLTSARLFYADFINLLDNYEMSTGVSETVTSEELKENRLFIDSMMETDLMKVRWL